MRDIENPMWASIVAPLQRALELPAWAKAAAALVGGAMHWVWSDAFFGALFVLLFSSAADWGLGKRSAKKGKGPSAHPHYSAAIAYMGLQTKAATIVQLFLVWGAIEWALLHVPLADWLKELLPLVPGVLTWGFILQDIESVRDHRARLGAKPNRWFDLVLKSLHAIPDKVLGPLHEEKEEDPEAAVERQP